MEYKCWKNNGKPDWAIKKDSLNPTTDSVNALAAESMATSTSAGVTLTHGDFEHLLNLAHGETNLPSAALVHSGISHSPPTWNLPWLVDSEATDHLTSSPHLFSTYSPFHTPMQISLAHGSKVPAVGKGSVSLNPNLILHNVLLVLSFPTSLLFVPKLCHTSSSQVILISSCCIFQDKNSKKKIGRGLSDGHLYYAAKDSSVIHISTWFILHCCCSPMAPTARSSHSAQTQDDGSLFRSCFSFTVWILSIVQA